MQTADFLDRVVAPGNFFGISYINRYGSWTDLFFPRDRVDHAIKFLAWCRHNNLQTWYAVGSYRLATPHKYDSYKGTRKHHNVQALKAFWVDIDIKAAHDKKDIGVNCFADMSTAVAWLGQFVTDTGLPPPNMLVDSGYGLHGYWLISDALSRDEWQPYAEALKALLLKEGATIDLGLVSDSSRVLRAPGTFNLKVPADPKPIAVLGSRDDYPNATVLDVLRPHVVAVKTRVQVTRTGSGPSLPGAPAPVYALRQDKTGLTEAAGIPERPRRPYLFSRIAERCEQVKRSVATGGAGDTRDLWYLGHLTLASFCQDAEDGAYSVSEGSDYFINPRSSGPGCEYDGPLGLDKAREQIADEVSQKGTGAPTCAKYNTYRPGVCETCQYWEKISSPYSLGVEDGDLPDPYYRHDGKVVIDVWVKAKKKEEGKWETHETVPGNVSNPKLDRVGDNWILSFTYERAGTPSMVSVAQTDIPSELAAARKILGEQGITGITPLNYRYLADFLMAWISKLRDERAERASSIPAFGWVKQNEKYNGLAIGGTYYRADGHAEPVPTAKSAVVRHYQPQGELEKWKEAAAFAMKDRPDLQVLVAAAFGAPLIEFTGHKGFVMSAWSRDSAVGKSSALTIGCTVWCDPLEMIQLDDTPNSIVHRIGTTRVAPAYWDEITLHKDAEEKYIATLFQLGQGREKARLHSDSTMKESGDWKTILCSTGNRPLMDTITKHRADTDAGALRLFEFLLEHKQLPLNPEAQRKISAAGRHYGTAGRYYARWLAQNAEIADKAVTQMQDYLRIEFKASQPERFFVAGLACLSVGARIARDLGLAPFDIPGMLGFLHDAFMKLREARKLDLPVNNGMVEIGKVLGEFLTDHASERLLTKRFHPANARTNVTWVPRKYGGRVVIHIADEEKRMRIQHSVWREWCYSRNYSPSDMTMMVIRRWGAKRCRVILGYGTDFATGQIEVLDIPLDNAELRAYKSLADIEPEQSAEHGS